MIHGIIAAQATAGGGPGTWTPDDLASPPAAWWNDTSSVTNVAGGASTWSDISGNGLDLSQATSTLYPTINASGLNGKRTLTFNGDRLDQDTTAGRAIFRKKSAGWALLVVANNDPSSLVRYQVFAGTSTNTARFSIASSDGSTARANRLGVRRQDGDSFTSISTAQFDTAYHVVLYTMDWANGVGTIYKDGAQVAQNLSLTTSGETSDTAGGTFYIGSNNSGSSTISDFAEIILGNGTLPTTDEIDQLFGYAHHNWGLTSLLDSGHPYKSAPP